MVPVPRPVLVARDDPADCARLQRVERLVILPGSLGNHLGPPPIGYAVPLCLFFKYARTLRSLGFDVNTKWMERCVLDGRGRLRQDGRKKEIEPFRDSCGARRGFDHNGTTSTTLGPFHLDVLFEAQRKRGKRKRETGYSFRPKGGQVAHFCRRLVFDRPSAVSAGAPANEKLVCCPLFSLFSFLSCP